VFEGGFASALANDGSKITVTGNGTFEPRERHEVTGGGTWTTFAPDGTTVTGHGTYRVQQLVRFDLAPGILTGAVDNIPGAKGDLTDTRAGLMFVRIAYSDGSKGVLVFSCGLDGSPASIFEGVTASKGYTDYWNTLPSLTLFHILSQDENRDRE
jgi:hypothetical protein